MYPEENQIFPTTQSDSLPAEQEYNYSTADSVFAWLSLVFAFLFCKALPVKEHPSGGFLLILALFATGFVILKLKKIKIPKACVLGALSSLVIGFALLFTNTAFLINLSFAYCLANFCYFLYAAFGNSVEQGFSDYIYVDYFKALILLPFSSLGAIFRALSNKGTRKGSQFMLNAILGIGVAILPTIVIFLCLSYDNGFTKILNDLFSFDEDKFSNTILSLIWTLPLAMYGFGMYASSARKHLQDKVTIQTCDDTLRKAQVLPQVTAAVAMLPILFLYVVFFISQWQYYVSGFTGVLPENFSYAEYARQGFFELCAVSVINLLLIISIAIFIRRNQEGSPVVLKIVTSIFCACTLVLISTAVAKLVMYIDYYGLTPKRIYAMWLMALIGIAFVLIAIGQFLRKFKTVAVCFSVAIVMFSCLAVCNVNSICAQYNADRYLSGSLETLDVDAMKEWGDSAIPSLVQVATSMDAEKDPDLKKEIDAVLSSRSTHFEFDKPSIFSFSVPTLRAKAALDEYIHD